MFKNHCEFEIKLLLLESGVSGNAASERYYTVFQQGSHFKFAGHSFYGSSKNILRRSQDLAKINVIWLT